MKWLKKVILDIVITIIIISTLFFKTLVLKVFLFIYTPIMLIGRILALTGMNIQKKGGAKAPDWFLHVLYCINVLVLVINRWWILAALWLVIWFLAFLYTKRSRKKPVIRKKRL